MMKKYIVLLFISLFGFAQQTPASKQTKSILILGAKAHLGNGKVIENSLISIIDGKIANHKCQFSWYCDGKKDIPEDSKTWEECLIIAEKVLYGMYDFTEGATHYHNDTVHPYWADHLAHVVTIDNHIFYK